MKGKSILTQMIKVEGMTCANCVNHVKQAILEIPQVRAVEVDLHSGSAIIDGDAIIPREALSSALDAAGYTLK